MTTNEYYNKYIDEPICQCIKCARFCHIDGGHNCGGNITIEEKKHPDWTQTWRNTSLWFVPSEKQINLQKHLDQNRKPSIIPDREFHKLYELLKNEHKKNK